jgi:hypothetical protein
MGLPATVLQISRHTPVVFGAVQRFIGRPWNVDLREDTKADGCVHVTRTALWLEHYLAKFNKYHTQ